MLSWFFEKEDVESALNGQLIEEYSIKCHPEKVTNAVLDENVDVFLIRKYGTAQAQRRTRAQVTICSC